MSQKFEPRQGVRLNFVGGEPALLPSIRGAVQLFRSSPLYSGSLFGDSDGGRRQVKILDAFWSEFDYDAVPMDGLRALSSACKGGLMAAVTGELLDDDLVVQRMAVQSQRHPLGFDKLLLAAKDGLQLRVHVWPAGRREFREDVHDHRFDFYSHIIAGGLSVENYAVREQACRLRNT